MPQYTWACDQAATSKRAKKLSEYFSERVLREDEFRCASADCCRSSYQGKGDFHEGQLHHVGRCYDLTCNGQPVRIAIVGQECGSDSDHIRLEERSKGIVEESGMTCRFKKDGPNHPGRNPHMRGCTSLLRLVFGAELGADYGGEFLNLADERPHMFECFALTNYLLCSALKPGASSKSGGAAGQATKTMWRNCGDHFREVMQILDPTLIVVQGTEVRRWIGTKFGLPPAGPSLPADPKDLIERIEIDGHASHLVWFAHPSAPRWIYNWGANEQTPYLKKTVKPAINEVRNRLGITCISNRSPSPTHPIEAL